MGFQAIFKYVLLFLKYVYTYKKNKEQNNFIRIGEYCGTDLPGDNGTIVSASPSMFLAFTSDSSQSKIFSSIVLYVL